MDHRAVKSRFVRYPAGSKGWRLWEPVSNTFMESAHAKWLVEEVGEKLPEENPATSVPIPNPLSTISKLLITMECTEDSLIEALQISSYLHHGSITKEIRGQDWLVKEIWVMVSGISGKLPKTFNAAMKSEESDLWKATCKKEIQMLKSMKLWEEFLLPAGKRAISRKWGCL